MAFQRAIRADRVVAGRISPARLGVRSIALTRHEGRALAFRNHCPHAGAPLANGRIECGHLVCRRHDWRFRLHDGMSPEHPDWPLRLLPTREVDGWIEVDWDEEEIW